MGAEGVCRVLLELAVDHFAETGKEELIAWEWSNSTELGRCILLLAEAGSIELAEDDTLESFSGWFDLHSEPSTWKLQW